MNVREVRRWAQTLNGPEAFEMVLGKMEDEGGLAETTDFDGYAELITKGRQCLTTCPDQGKADVLRARVHEEAEQLLSDMRTASTMPEAQRLSLRRGVAKCLVVVNLAICNCCTTDGKVALKKCGVCDDSLIRITGPFNPGSKPV